MGNSRKSKVHVIKWGVIPEPEEGTRAVMVPTFDGPLLRGNLDVAPVVGVCGACGHKLTEGVPVSQVQNIVIRCFECQAFNEALA